MSLGTAAPRPGRAAVHSPRGNLRLRTPRPSPSHTNPDQATSPLDLRPRSVYERGTFAPGMNMCSFQSGQSLPAEQQRRPVIDRLAIFDSLGHCIVGMRWQGMVDLLKEHVEEGGSFVGCH